jgi:uncharacterized membrane protein YhaH (DUF805 family)
MTFLESIRSGLNKYANSSGRASRSEYWYWSLFALLVDIVSMGLDALIFPGAEWGVIGVITGLGLFLPGLAVSIRRLHDIDRSGYWILIALTIVGILLLIYWACVRGTDGDNDFGPDPLAAPGARPTLLSAQTGPS